LTKAASNAPHTLHAQDSLALVVPEICRGSQKLKVGHVTALRTPVSPTFAYLWLSSSSSYIRLLKVDKRTKF